MRRNQCYLDQPIQLCAAIGTLTCGFVTDRLVARDTGWQVGVAALDTLISVPFGLLFFLWPSGVAFEVGASACPPRFSSMWASPFSRPGGPPPASAP